MLPDQNICTGCGACAAACPSGCLTMVPGEEGFCYPVADPARCTQCGLCEGVCPALRPGQGTGMPEALAVKNRDAALRRDSSSGGVFTALARDTLARGGWVCGAIYDEYFAVRHVLTKQEGEIAPMRGAKYSQSRAEDCFPRIQGLLEENTPVLFAGTPCQCAGLRAFLGGDPPGLLTVDMVCHGVPSEKVWIRWLDFRRKTDAPGASITGVNLRSKASGWSRYSYSVEISYSDGSCYRRPQGQDAFLRGFVQNLYLRPSCARCQHKGLSRQSDLTLGDFWGIWELHPEFDDDRGVSLLLLQSEKGRQAWGRIAGDFDALTVDCSQAVAQNPSALHPSQPHKNREKFFRGLEKTNDLESWINTCLAGGKPSLLSRLRRLRQWL